MMVMRMYASIACVTPESPVRLERDMIPLIIPVKLGHAQVDNIDGLIPTFPTNQEIVWFKIPDLRKGQQPPYRFNVQIVTNLCIMPYSWRDWTRDIC